MVEDQVVVVEVVWQLSLADGYRLLVVELSGSHVLVRLYHRLDDAACLVLRIVHDHGVQLAELELGNVVRGSLLCLHLL